MKLDEMLGSIRETLTASRVFGTPVDKDGVTVIPAAVVYGGGGGGTGLDGTVIRGDGGGMGMVARPIGAFVIQGGTVRWVPAVDVSRVLATVGMIAVGGLLAGARIARLVTR